ncbi:hypothetical protein CHRY9390_03264 [Chryseobacterium aquaeductus]|uniref:Uncharacterized protein n=1 Tax=Chryseobacterium aquaeductus TaxID=2675056 RepID=A0A9N8MKD8_9FLAO|nr:hypothetical protein CHRY9390_03264 [Chryseobacterium potabilaquae]CAD7823569.1 hypothetical protein CHRY9390_03264 [Chryseobacterium aquaeductus]
MKIGQKLKGMRIEKGFSTIEVAEIRYFRIHLQKI